MKDKIIELFKSGDVNNIKLGMTLAEGQGFDLQKLCRGYEELDHTFSFATMTLDDLIHTTSNIKYLYNRKNVSLIPNSIDLCKSLEILNLGNSRIKALPNEMANLHNLKRLYLNNNDFRIIPEVIFEIPNLEFIDLQFTKLTGNDEMYIKREFDKRNIECLI